MTTTIAVFKLTSDTKWITDIKLTTYLPALRLQGAAAVQHVFLTFDRIRTYIITLVFLSERKTLRGWWLAPINPTYTTKVKLRQQESNLRRVTPHLINSQADTPTYHHRNINSPWENRTLLVWLKARYPATRWMGHILLPKTVLEILGSSLSLQC
mgnify:CR=1 FL=1